MTRHLLIPLTALTALSLGLSGCGTLVDCTTEARASVQLTVVDGAGAAIDGASAQYTIESESWPSPQPCESVGGGVLVCGWEVEDTFHIDVSAPGYLSQTVQVEVWADQCHVITEEVGVTMQAG